MSGTPARRKDSQLIQRIVSSLIVPIALFIIGYAAAKVAATVTERLAAETEAAATFEVDGAIEGVRSWGTGTVGVRLSDGGFYELDADRDVLVALMHEGSRVRISCNPERCTLTTPAAAEG